MIIKIYGERNTGTNYLERLLLTHLDVVQYKDSAFIVPPADKFIDLEALSCVGWKHRLVSAKFFQDKAIRPEDILIVTLTKNPYSWLLSLHKRPYSPIHLRSAVITRKETGTSFLLRWIEKNALRVMARLGKFGRSLRNQFPQWCVYEDLAFHDFVRHKWFAEFQGEPIKKFKNPVQLWNQKNKAYLELAKHYQVITMTYEELLASPEAMLRRITDRLGYSLSQFNNVHSAVKNEDKDNTEKNHQYYQDYYLNERWQKKLSKKAIKRISSRLDPEVMKAFSYKFLEN